MKIKLITPVILSAVLFAVIGCGSEGEDGDTGAAQAEVAEVNLDSEGHSPEHSFLSCPTAEANGQAIAATMLEGLKEANGLLKEKPPVSQVKAQLATLSEKYIQKMVALGKFRETFNEDDKQLSHNHFYTAQFTAEFTEAQSEHNSFHNVYQQYRDEYPDFWKSYNSLLYLGDYAEFEMLKQNLPDEAVRLSIK